MTNKHINIDVSGGSAHFGNVVQGEEVKVTDASSQAVDPALMRQCFAEIRRLGEAAQVSGTEIRQLKDTVESLDFKQEKSSLSTDILAIYETYSWAIEPLKKLFTTILG